MNWDQFRAIVWLRWRLSWNRLVRAGSLNAVLSVILLSSLAAGAMAAGAGGVLLGMFAFAKLAPQGLLAIWDGVVVLFLLFWLAGLLAEIQRAESIDLSKLLHLPLSLRQVFVFNYLASHFSPAILLFLPGMLGISLGLALGAGVRMALLLPLVLGFLFMVTAWTYCLRGWLSALMINKRRRRAVLVWVTLIFVLIFQLPGVLINTTFAHKRRQNRPAQSAASQRPGLPEDFLRGHLLVPLGWPGYGAMSLKQHQAWPALGALAASCLLGSLGLMRSYRSTLRFYQGAESRSTARRSAAPQTPEAPRGVVLVERTLPWLPDDTAALALAMLRSLLRAPEMKMALIMPIVAGAAFSSVFFSRLHLQQAVPQPLSGFIAPAAAILAAFSFGPMMANTFGLDRNGFRGLVLLPTPREQILLAKNLAFVPLVGSVGVALLLLAEGLLRISWDVLVTGLLEIVMAFMLFSLMCNLNAILAPYRTAAGTLQAKKPKPIVFLAMGLTMFGLPLVLWPVLIPPALQWLCTFLNGFPARLPVNVAAASALLAGVAWLYRLLLPLQGRLLQRREQRILLEVTEEAE